MVAGGRGSMSTINIDGPALGPLGRGGVMAVEEIASSTYGITIVNPTSPDRAGSAASPQRRRLPSGGPLMNRSPSPPPPASAGGRHGKSPATSKAKSPGKYTCNISRLLEDAARRALPPYKGLPRPPPSRDAAFLAGV